MASLISGRMTRRAGLYFALTWLIFISAYESSKPTLYRRDPGTAFLTSLLVSAIITGATTGVELLVAAKRKAPKIDKGKVDDIRVTSSEYGATLPLVYGNVRMGGNIIWSTSVHHTTRTTGGHGGGKGGPKAPQETEHIYTTSFAVALCDNQIDKVSRIWADNVVILDTTGEDLGDAFYEAEDAGNTLAGGASVIVDTDASDGNSVSLPTNASVKFNDTYGDGSIAVLEFFYASTAANTVEFDFNGSISTATLANSNGVYTVYRTPLALTSGFVNDLKIKNTHATTLKVDRLAIRISGRNTNIEDSYVDPTPGSPDDVRPRFNHIPQIEVDGSTTVTLSSGGNVNIRIYTGTETQTPDSAIVADKGAGNAPAYRGTSYVVFDSYQLPDGRFPNLTFEVKTSVVAIDDVVESLYSKAGVSSSNLSLTSVSSDTLTGLIVHQRTPLKSILEDLEQTFQFDLPEIDGKVKAVKRNGSSEATITTDELRCVAEGEEIPPFDAVIEDADELALPKKLTVDYLDPERDYQNNTQQSISLSGNAQDIQSVSLPLVMSANSAKQLADTIRAQRFNESRTFKFQCGPKHLIRHPGSVVTLPLTNATHVIRITEQRVKGLMCEFEGVRHAASLYTQTSSGSEGTGFERGVTAVPGATKLLILDLPLLRPEDGGDGTQPVKYCAACLRGSGAWVGSFLYKERPKDSGAYELETTFENQATIGVIASGTAGVIDRTVWDRTTSFVTDFYPDSTLSSATEADCAGNPELNLFSIGSMETGWYIGQFSTVSAGSPSSPYQSRYTISGLLWDRFGSGAPPAGSLAGLDFVLLNSAVKPRSVELTDIGVARNYKAATSGQSTDVAETVTFTLEGNSLKVPKPVHPHTFRDQVSTYFTTWTRASRIAPSLRDYAGAALGEEGEQYVMEIYTPALDFLRRVIVDPTRPHPPFLNTTGGVGLTGNSLTSGGLSEGLAWTVQPFYVADSGGDYFVEASFRHNGTFIEYFGLHTAGANGVRPAGDFEVRIANAIGGGQIEVYEGGVLIVTDDVFDNSFYTPRIRFRVRNGRVAVFRVLDASTGFSEVQLYEFSIPAPTLWAYIQIGGGSRANDVQVLDHQPTFVYPAAEQTTDFGSDQATLYQRIYQRSAIIGRGHTLDIIADSTVLPALTAGDCAVTESDFG
jgi:hypothetical protein